MDYEARLEVSFYREISPFDQEHRLYLVQHQETKKFFVKKFLDTYNLTFYRQLMEHPISGIPRIYALSEEDGVLTVIEEYVSGDTLATVLEQNGTLDEARAADYCYQLCNILSKLQYFDPAIVCQEIKLSDVVLTPQNRIVLLTSPSMRTLSEPSDSQEGVRAVGVFMNMLLTGSTPEQQPASGKLSRIIKTCTRPTRRHKYKTILGVAKAIADLNLYQKKTDFAPKSYTESFAPPGFRRGNPFHMLIAILGYVSILCLTFLHQARGYSATIFMIRFQKVFFMLGLLFAVFFCCNYRNIQSYFPLCQSNIRSLRVLMILFYTVLFVFVAICAGVWLGAVLNMLFTGNRIF